jgi:hypothetical protein
MCEDCLKEAVEKLPEGLSEGEREEFIKAARTMMESQDRVSSIIVKHALQVAMEQKPDGIGPPTVTHALAIALGGFIGRAPEELRGTVFASALRTIVATMNKVMPDGERMEMRVTQGNGESARDNEEIRVRPPVLH